MSAAHCTLLPVAALTCALALLPGCATPSAPRPEVASTGRVEAKQIPAADDERYVQGNGTTYALPLPASENAMPGYPATLLAAELPPRTIAARLIFNEQGEVVEVRGLQDDTSNESDAFLASVREACRNWAYTPLIERRRVTMDGSDGPTQSTIETAKPFHLDFEFTFSQSGGLGHVDGQASPDKGRERR